MMAANDLTNFYEHSEVDDWIALLEIPNKRRRLDESLNITTATENNCVENGAETTTNLTKLPASNPFNEVYDEKTFVLNKSSTKMLMLGVLPSQKSKPFFKCIIKLFDTTKYNFCVTLDRRDLRRMYDIFRQNYGFHSKSSYIDVHKYTIEELMSSTLCIKKPESTKDIYKVICNDSIIYLGIPTIKKLFELEYFIFVSLDNINIEKYNKMMECNLLNEVSQVAQPSGFDEEKIKIQTLSLLDYEDEFGINFIIQTLNKFWNFFYDVVKYHFEERDEVDGNK